MKAPVEELQTWAEKIVAQMSEQQSYYHSFIVVREFALACNNAVSHSLYNIMAHFKRDGELVQSPF